MPGWLQLEQVAGFGRNTRLESSESASTAAATGACTAKGRIGARCLPTPRATE
jgi:hypothetical protein